MKIWAYLVDEHALGDVFAGIPTWGLLLAIALTVLMLTKGADWMIDGAVDLALRTKLPKIVIGATILSLGTTAPEAFVSVMAAFMGNPGLALGNGVGSIIADTGLIFGMTALVAAPPMNKWILNRTGWWQIGSAVLLVALAGGALLLNPEDPVISRPMGLLLIALLMTYMVMTYRWARSGKDSSVLVGTEMEVSEHKHELSMTMTLVTLLGGLALVITASRLLIPAASETAGRLGVPDDVIAATMVALGTSLPELTTAIAAIRKGHPEITVGNIVGADVLNSLFVIGAASLAVPLSVPPTFFRFHFPAMLLILVSFRVFIGMGKDGRFRRWQGVWLLALYGVYIALQYILN
ncbi:MAG: calcium/sodium antiporter [Spirochaetaceae bacterium]|nr:calcium/sodium antiporter [Spirochaetaceae bacterium]MDT8296868.1 calcium/sodium antiporter [Spirochaetaceae bacterium]